MYMYFLFLSITSIKYCSKGYYEFQVQLYITISYYYKKKKPNYHTLET